jgi:hypothetical protein
MAKRFDWSGWDNFDDYRTDDECPELGEPDPAPPQDPSDAALADEAERSKYRPGWYAPGSEEDLAKPNACPRIESVVMSHSILINSYIREQGK